VEEVPEHLEYNHLLEPRPAPVLRDGRVDYRAQSPFIVVKQGQALAKLRYRRAGRDGRDIHGMVIPHAARAVDAVTAGANTRMEGRLLLADINGQLILERGVVSVSPTLTIKGGVDYRTGNIVFPGDVIIDGPVSDGFSVYAGGSVTAKQTLDVTDLIARDDLTVTGGGIIGRGAASARAGGRVRARFIENCRVACRGEVTVDGGVINARVYTLQSVVTGDKGRVVGGEIYAVHGVRVGGVGAAKGAANGAGAARIHCGVDFTALQTLEKNNNLLLALAARVERVKALLDTARDPARRAGLEEILRRLDEARGAAQAAVAGALARVEADRAAAVEVTGEIAPGTLIEICQTALFVTKPLKRVRVRLDPYLGRLTPEDLK